MSGTKISAIIIVIILIILGIWWYSGSQQAQVPVAPVADTTSAPVAQAPVTPPSQSDLMQASIKSSGTSDAAINQDLSAVDGQMVSLNSDATNINQSLNDTPVAQ